MKESIHTRQCTFTNCKADYFSPFPKNVSKTLMEWTPASPDINLIENEFIFERSIFKHRFLESNNDWCKSCQKGENQCLKNR